MKSIEQIRLENRQRVLDRLGPIVFNRHLTLDEANKINLMLDIGKTVPEVIKILRRKNENSGDDSYSSDKISSSTLHVMVNHSGAKCSRTPLEMYFHRYVS